MAKTGITQQAIDEIKARTDIGELIASYGVETRRAGSTLKACCPFHHEKTPSFVINESQGYYHCFGCGESGDAISFVRKIEGLDFVEAVRKLAASAGVELVEREEDPEARRRGRLYALMAELAEFYHRCLGRTREAQAARDYLSQRQLDGSVQDDWLIGYAPKGMAPMSTWAQKHGYTVQELAAAGVIKPPEGANDAGYHRFGGRLIFTVRDERGRVVAFSGRQIVPSKHSGKYVNSPATEIFAKSRVLFAYDRVRHELARRAPREIICCEGQIDVIRMHMHGFATAVASQGTAFTDEHAEMVCRRAESAVLMFDDDAAGHKATAAVAVKLLARGMPVKVAVLPGGHDPDSYLREFGAEKMRDLIARSESVVGFCCRTLRAGEAHPDAPDAVARIVRRTLETIAASSSPVLRAAMANETARLLGLPGAAVEAELEQLLRSRTPAIPVSPAAPVSSAATVAPVATPPAAAAPDGATVDAPEPAVKLPPAIEVSFMSFLLANEYDANLAAMAGRHLPEQVFAGGFTARFLSVWRDETAQGCDLVGAWADSLDAADRAVFDRALAAAGQTAASTLRPEEIMRDYIRSLWCERLRRERENLPAGDGDSAARRLRISMDLKSLQRSRWQAVKELTERLTKGENG